MAEDITNYSLRFATPWMVRPYPGPHCVIDPSNITTEQANKLVKYNFKSGVYDSQEIVNAVVISGLNLLILDAYKRVTEEGVCTYTYQTTNDPRDINKELRRLYGRLSPVKRKAMDTTWSEPWNRAIPIEYYFKGLGEMFILTNIHPPNFTIAQMVQRTRNSDGEMWIVPNASE